MIHQMIVHLALVLQPVAAWAPPQSTFVDDEPGLEAVSQDVAADSIEGADQQDAEAEHTDDKEAGDTEAGDVEPSSDQATSGSWIDSDPRLQALFGNGDEETWSMHKLNYAAIGADDAKVQTSFKYRMLTESNWYLSYTVVVGWDLYEPSLPFRDINFMPEVFYRWEPSGKNPYSVDVGYWHNSNGKDSKDSRAWDRADVRTVIQGKIFGRNMVIVPSVYATIAESGKNEDIAEYLGNWDARFLWHSLIDPKGNDLDLHVVLMAGRDNSPFDRGSIEVSLSYQIPNARFKPRLYLQYFSGYGDTLFEYNERKSTVRFGVAL